MDFINIEDNYLQSQILIKDNIKVFELEKLLLSYISSNKKKEIVKFIYDASKKNTDFIADIYDEKMLKSLKREICDFDGFDDWEYN